MAMMDTKYKCRTGGLTDGSRVTTECLVEAALPADRNANVTTANAS